jgi:hypothetical protein
MAFIQAALSEFNNDEDLNDVECNEEIRLETGIAGCPLTGFEHANS